MSTEDCASELSLDPKKDRAILEKCTQSCGTCHFSSTFVTANDPLVTGAALCRQFELTAADFNVRWLRYSFENSNAELSATTLVRDFGLRKCILFV